MTKKEIRSMIAQKKKALSPDEILEYSEKVCERLINEPIYQKASAVYVYLAYNQEIITEPLIRRAWQDGKLVAAPKCLENNSMEFFFIRSFADTAPGYCNIPEPVSEDIAECDEALIIMPGIAFDRSFNRIGYGGGFYDRYLEHSSNRRFTTAALAYDFQLLEAIPSEAHDHRVDAVITADSCMYSPAFKLP